MKFHVFLLYVCILEFKGATRPSFSSSYLNMSTGIETRCKFLNCLPFLPLSNPFLWLPALSCSLLSFQGGWVDRRKWWHTDVRTYGRIDRKTELNFNRCLQKKKGADTQTDRYNSYSIIILNNLLTLINDYKLSPNLYFCKREER